MKLHQIYLLCCLSKECRVLFENISKMLKCWTRLLLVGWVAGRRDPDSSKNRSGLKLNGSPQSSLWLMVHKFMRICLNLYNVLNYVKLYLKNTKFAFFGQFLTIVLLIWYQFSFFLFWNKFQDCIWFKNRCNKNAISLQYKILILNQDYRIIWFINLLDYPY